MCRCVKILAAEMRYKLLLNEKKNLGGPKAPKRKGATEAEEDEAEPAGEPASENPGPAEKKRKTKKGKEQDEEKPAPKKTTKKK